MKHGMIAYGIYVALMQCLEEAENHKLSKDYDMIAYDMRTETEVVQSVVEDFGLFEVEDGFFFSKDLSEIIEQSKKVSEARARAGRAGGVAKAKNSLANAKQMLSKCQDSSSKCQANAKEKPSKCQANASDSLANAKQMQESKESSPNPSKNIYSVPTEREDNIKLSSPSSVRAKRTAKPKEFTICHKGRKIFEAYYQELYESAYYWQAKDAKAMNSILKKISFARSHKAVPLPTDDDSLLEAWDDFLHRIDKTWIMNNFSVNKIDSQYNEIVSEMKNHKQNANDNGNNTRLGWKAPEHKDTSAYRAGFGTSLR